MWNGSFKRTAVFLAVSFIAAGCDMAAAPVDALQAAPGAVPARQAAERYQTDPARNRTWVLTGAGVILYDLKRPGRTLIPLPGWHWAGGRYGCAPDLALGPKGEAVITSDVLPTLWKIDPQTLQVSVHPLALDADAEKDVGFSELAYSARHGAYFAVSHAHHSLWKVDPLLSRAQKTALARPAAPACIS